MKLRTTITALLASSLTAGCTSMEYTAHDAKQSQNDTAADFQSDDLPPQILSVVSIPNPVGNNATVTIEAYVLDDYGVDAVFSSLGEESAQSVSMDASAAPRYRITYDASTLPLGENIFSLLAVDTAGQQSHAEGSFTVNNVTGTMIEDIVVAPDWISTADLAVPVAVTLTATDSFYDSSVLEGSCSLQDIDLGTLAYNPTNKIHELSFLPEDSGITTTTLGEFPVTCTIVNPAEYSVTDTALVEFYDGIPPALDCTMTQAGKNDGSLPLEITCIATDENGVNNVMWEEGTLGEDTFTNTEGDTWVAQIDVANIPADNYALLVTAYDNEGNDSSDAVAGIINDVIVPNTSCSLNDSTITNNSTGGSGVYNTDTTFTCTVIDESSLDSVTYDADALGSGTMVGSGSTYSVTLTASEEAAKGYVISGIARDRAGNSTTVTDTLTVVDELVPSFTAVTVTPGSVINDGTEEFSLEACVEDETDGTELGNSITLAIDLYANSLSYDSGTACYGITINGDEFSEGTYTITLKATDAAGNSAEDTSGMIAIESVSFMTTTLYTDTDTRTSEESPLTNYNGYPLYVGASSAGRGRSYLSFDSSKFEGADIISAFLTIYAAGGTCRSSTNNHDCNHDLVAEVHEIPTAWDAATLTWNSAPSYDSPVVDSVTMNEAYGGGGSYTFDITSLAQTWANGSNYGALLKADSTGESTSDQVDIAIDSYETGIPAILEVTYSVE